jgi:hypothetical protein
VARQVGVGVLDLEAIQMVSFPASMDFQAGYMLTVGSFT